MADEGRLAAVLGGAQEAGGSDERRAEELAESAAALQGEGRAAEAVTMYEEALRIRRAVAGASHPVVAMTMLGLAAALEDRAAQLRAEGERVLSERLSSPTTSSAREAMLECARGGGRQGEEKE